MNTEEKMPGSIIAKQIDYIMNLSKRSFKTDKEILNWLFTKNDKFDNLSPYKMICIGEGDKIVNFLVDGAENSEITKRW